MCVRACEVDTSNNNVAEQMVLAISPAKYIEPLSSTVDKFTLLVFYGIRFFGVPLGASNRCFAGLLYKHQKNSSYFTLNFVLLG